MATMSSIVGYNGMKKVFFPKSRRKSRRTHQKDAGEADCLTGTEWHQKLGYEDSRFLCRKYTDLLTGQTVLLVGQVDKIEDDVVVELKTVRNRRNIKKQIRHAKKQVLCYCYLTGAKKYRIVVLDAVTGRVIKEIEGKFKQDKLDKMMHRYLSLVAQSGRQTTSSRQLRKHRKNSNSDQAWILRFVPESLEPNPVPA